MARRCSHVGIGLHLAYGSQREVPHNRALHKAQGIHEKLGGTGIIHEPVSKPKGMHWRTYYRHTERLQEAESVYTVNQVKLLAHGNIRSYELALT